MKLTLKQLRDAPYNPRKIGDKALEALGYSLNEFGDISGIVWNKKTKHLVCGHQRIRALKEQFGLVFVKDNVLIAQKVTGNGAKHPGHKFSIRIVDWDESKEKAANIAANSYLISGEFTDGLGSLVDKLRADLPDLSVALRFGDLDIPELLSEPNEQDDDIPIVPEKPKSKIGDLYILGNHRLLCGDATKQEDVERLMDGQKADMVFTDPPYGMEYKGKVFGKQGIINDGKEWQNVLKTSISNIIAYIDNAVVAICFAPARLPLFFEATKQLKYERRLTIYKPNRMANPWNGWIMTSEDINLFSIGKPMWNKQNHCHDVYVFDYSERPPREIDHPNVKPVSICVDVIQKCSNNLVLDVFLGSGSTLIACEKTNRKCCGMEIAPHYCDVIVKRWEDFTGRKAELSNG